MTKQIHELGSLFADVQLQNILGDGKTFPDCVARKSLDEIQHLYEESKSRPGFDLKEFVHTHFELPNTQSADYKSDASHSATDHIKALWDLLTRMPDKQSGSLIPLPHPYIVPGGRFREIYYWDSYFTLLGLQASGRKDMIQHMISNFAYLIDTYGYIPNGNRTYFLGRSQPPFFSLMVKLLGAWKKNAPTYYLPQLEKEYAFWMHGVDSLNEKRQAAHRVVRMPGGETLNRYWDESAEPRPESYKEDIELAHHSTQNAEYLFRHLRAAAESGWDFSSRWFKDPNSFASIHTTEIIPVDLNCLLLHLEQMIADAYTASGDRLKSSEFQAHSQKRRAAILNYCWNEAEDFFFDYDFVANKQKTSLTLAGVFPLFFELATPDQAMAIEKVLKEKFLKAGGLTTTLINSGQQWDAPNGWAPLQWIAYKGLKNYGFDELAEEIKKRWTNANNKVFSSTGKMTEKYDVWNDHAEASGGEYPNQDGFGWTNGVYLAMNS